MDLRRGEALASLGYGSYLFVVREISHLEPAVVLSMFTWDDSDADQNHREMNIELARWGDAGNKNAQFVVQPFYVPANVVRFNAPPGALTHSFRWESGKVTFRTVRGVVTTNGSDVVTEHTLLRVSLLQVANLFIWICTFSATTRTLCKMISRLLLRSSSTYRDTGN